MKSIVIDIGNTRTKYAVFENKKLIQTYMVDQLDADTINSMYENHQAEAVILSSVVNVEESTLSQFKERFDIFLELSHSLKFPFTSIYKTPETLGKDRVAAIAGGQALFPGTNLLIIDAGTAITFDLLTQKKVHEGGTISPGLSMRFKALNAFTNKLPLIHSRENSPLMGLTTEEAIRSGVQAGMRFEIDGYIKRLKRKYPGLKVILTGGDANFFDKTLKNTIFVNLNLNFIGLNRILLYNAT